MAVTWTSSKPCPNCGAKGPARKCNNCFTLGCYQCVAQNLGSNSQCNLCKKRGGIAQP